MSAEHKPHSDRHARLMRGEITVDEYVAEVKSDVNERLAAWREVALAHKASDQERGQRIFELEEQLEALQTAVDDAALVFVDTKWFDSYHHLASSSVATGDGRGIALPPIESAPAELPRISPPFGMAASSKREEAGADDSNPASRPS